MKDIKHVYIKSIPSLDDEEVAYYSVIIKMEDGGMLKTDFKSDSISPKVQQDIEDAVNRLLKTN